MPAGIQPADCGVWSFKVDVWLGKRLGVATCGVVEGITTGAVVVRTGLGGATGVSSGGRTWFCNMYNTYIQ